MDTRSIKPALKTAPRSWKASAVLSWMRSNAIAIVGTADATKSYSVDPAQDIANRHVDMAWANSSSLTAADPTKPRVVMGFNPIRSISTETFCA